MHKRGFTYKEASVWDEGRLCRAVNATMDVIMGKSDTANNNQCVMRETSSNDVPTIERFLWTQ